MTGFLDDLFDFNGDGKTDIGEEWVAFKMFEECVKDDSEDDSSFDDLYEWRAFCEDSSQYGVSPYTYEAEHEYEEALEKAKTAYAERHKYDWRLTCEDNEFDIAPEDYETQEEYEAAVEEREYNWADYLSDEIREKTEEYFLEADEFSSEDELLELLRQLDEAAARQTEGRSQPEQPPVNTLLEKALDAAAEEGVLAALREGIQENAKLTIRTEISMDPSDGAGATCVYVVECVDRDGRWALAYTGEEAAQQEKTDAGVYITYYQESLLRSLISIPEVDGVLFKSKAQSFGLSKQDISAMLAGIELREEAWDAICTRRTILLKAGRNKKRSPN